MSFCATGKNAVGFSNIVAYNVYVRKTLEQLETEEAAVLKTRRDSRNGTPWKVYPSTEDRAALRRMGFGDTLTAATWRSIMNFLKAAAKSSGEVVEVPGEDDQT